MGERRPDSESYLQSQQNAANQPPRQTTIPRRPVPSQSTSPSAMTGISNPRKVPGSDVADRVSEPSPRRESDQNQHQHNLWLSTWLRRRSLFAFIALFAAFDASLIALWRSNVGQDGFRTTISSNHYAWTYGPTAILVLVLGLWRQVDYNCKIMQPWWEMRKGPSAAAQSVLLDYVSPLNINSFIRAARNAHTPVLSSIAGFATLKLIILFSTGLLVLTPTSISDTFPAAITTRFDGSAFWDTIPDDNYFINTIQGLSPYDNVSASPVHTYLGLLNNEISDPKGTVDGKAFLSFEAQAETPLSSLSLEVSAFIPNITCEVAEVTPWYPSEATLALKLDTSTCSVGYEHQSELRLFGTIGEGCTPTTCPPFKTLYDMWRVNCSEADDNSGRTTLNTETPYDFRYALAVANVSYPIIVNSMNVTTTNMTAHDIAVVVCKVDYSIDQATVEHDLDQDTYSVSDTIPGSELNNLTGLMLGEIVYSSFGAADNLLMTDDDDIYFDPLISLFYVMLRTLDGDQIMDRFLSSDVLQRSATNVLGGVATQFMQQFFLASADESALGNGVYIEERLHIGMVSLWFMVAGFALLIVFCLFIIFTGLREAVPQDPGSIASSATLLYASPSMQKLLHGTGSHRSSQLKEKLQGWVFQTHVGDSFSVKAAYEGAPAKTVSASKPKEGFWIPIAARYWMIALTFCSPLAAIGSLEAIYRVSKANQGIADVSNSEEQASYLSRYLSAAIMLLIATSFNSLDFAIASFAPFSLLRSGAVPASRSLYFTLQGDMPPVALYKSLRTLYLSSALSNLAGIIGSVLTIVASGLFIIDFSVVSGAPVTASLASDWNVNWVNSSLNDSGAAVVLDQIQHGSVRFPPRIWNDLVFPDISTIQKDDGRSSISGSATQNFTFDVTAVRPVLTCEIVKDEYITVRWSDGEPNEMYVNALPPLPAGCQMGGVEGTNEYTNFTAAPYSLSPSQTTWIGYLYDIHLGKLMPDYDPNTTIPEYGEDYNSARNQPDNPAGCPSIGIIFAETNEDKTTYDDVTVLLCSQQLEQLTAAVTYDGSDVRRPNINPNIPPIPDESTARFLNNGTDGVESFPYRVQAQFMNNLTDFNTGGEQLRMDSFFNTLAFGPDGTGLKDLAGRANRDRLLQALQSLYAKYMVLALDMHLRQPLGTTAGDGAAQLLTGTMQTTTSRLQVNAASKLALQIMLAAMTALGTSAFWLTDLRGTLPRDPSSVASSMGFLAGSDLCDAQKPLLPRGAEWLAPRDLQVALQGWLFSLGWWTQRGGGVGAAGGGGGQDVAHPHSDSLEHANQTSLLAQHEKQTRRFGIDVGRPEQLGLRETRWWALRRRLRSRKEF